MISVFHLSDKERLWSKTVSDAIRGDGTQLVLAISEQCTAQLDPACWGRAIFEAATRPGKTAARQRMLTSILEHYRCPDLPEKMQGEILYELVRKRDLSSIPLLIEKGFAFQKDAPGRHLLYQVMHEGIWPMVDVLWPDALRDTNMKKYLHMAMERRQALVGVECALGYTRLAGAKGNRKELNTSLAVSLHGTLLSLTKKEKEQAATSLVLLAEAGCIDIDGIRRSLSDEIEARMRTVKPFLAEVEARLMDRQAAPDLVSGRPARRI